MALGPRRVDDGSRSGVYGSAWSLTASLPRSVTSNACFLVCEMTGTQTCLIGQGREEKTWSSGLPGKPGRLSDPMLPLQGSWVQSLIGEQRSIDHLVSPEKEKAWNSGQCLVHGNKNSASLFFFCLLLVEPCVHGNLSSWDQE